MALNRVLIFSSLFLAFVIFQTVTSLKCYHCNTNADNKNCTEGVNVPSLECGVVNGTCYAMVYKPAGDATAWKYYRGCSPKGLCNIVEDCNSCDDENCNNRAFEVKS